MIFMFYNDPFLSLVLNFIPIFPELMKLELQLKFMINKI
jgi:hypothetical protein